MEEEKPGWGATIGMFFLFGCLTMGVCIATSSMLVHSAGYSGYSNGGLLSTIVAIGCAAYYRSTGKIGTPAIAAAAAGVVLGFIAVTLATSAM